MGQRSALLPAFTSETVIGGPFGPNRAAAFPVTHSSTLVTHATAGVSAGVTAPATGSLAAATAVRGSCPQAPMQRLPGGSTPEQ